MKRLIALLLACTLASTAMAHQYRRLTLSPTGAIPELPAPYAATRLRVEFKGQGRAARLATIVLSVPGRETRLPPCLLAQIPPTSRKAIELSGSWYHDLSDLPPYLHLRLRPTNGGRNRVGPEDIELLFSLRDAHLISAQHDVPVGADDMQVRALDVSCG
jgi:hypothetical protein